MMHAQLVAAHAVCAMLLKETYCAMFVAQGQHMCDGAVL